jgi:hypothetical protein
MTTRREFLEIAAVTVVTAVWRENMWGAEAKAAFLIGPLVVPAKKFPSLGSAATIWVSRVWTHRKPFTLFTRQSMRESTFSITAGITTEEKAR